MLRLKPPQNLLGIVLIGFLPLALFALLLTAQRSIQFIHHQLLYDVSMDNLLQYSRTVLFDRIIQQQATMMMMVMIGSRRVSSTTSSSY